MNLLLRVVKARLWHVYGTFMAKTKESRPVLSRARILGVAGDPAKQTLTGSLNAGFYKSIRSCLRNDHWYQKLVWSYREWHLVTRITFGKLRPTSHWCFWCPDKSMAPVLAITDMVARARRDDSLL